jgi:hypothetical protein
MDDLEKIDTSEPKTGNNQVVEGVHVLFCLGLHQDARVKLGAHRTSATD